MASGFFALLDDISALVKTAAASIDDVPAQVAKTSGKVSGIVIDDTAVTPKYVVGLDPSRELSIIFRIARRSLVNKLLILSPAALLLGYFAPWLIAPVLMLGGAYLCYEGYEKVHGLFHAPAVAPDPQQLPHITPEDLEKQRVAGAVRTDMILSAEIMAISYGEVAHQPVLNQVMIMAAVAVFITIAVYGFVGLIVKADDIGLHLSQDKYHSMARRFGRGIVQFMPKFLTVLSYVGTAAMLWVGAEIVLHGIPATAHLLHELTLSLSPARVAWLVTVIVCAISGLVIGFVVDRLVVATRSVYQAFRRKRQIP